jgi:hypothetical protein
VFLDKLRATLKSGDYKHHDRLIERLLEEGFASLMTRTCRGPTELH